MRIVIEQVMTATPELAAHYADMEPTAPAESRHALQFDSIGGSHGIMNG